MSTYSLDQGAASLGAVWMVLAETVIFWNLNEIYIVYFNMNSAKTWLGDK